MLIMAGASSSNSIFPHRSLLCRLHFGEAFGDGHDYDDHHHNIHVFDDALNSDDDKHGNDDDDDDDDNSHQVGLPSTGITVFGSQLHTHGTGRKVGHHHHHNDHHRCVDGHSTLIK